MSEQLANGLIHAGLAWAALMLAFYVMGCFNADTLNRPTFLRVNAFLLLLGVVAWQVVLMVIIATK